MLLANQNGLWQKSVSPRIFPVVKEVAQTLFAADSGSSDSFILLPMSKIADLLVQLDRLFLGTEHCWTANYKSGLIAAGEWLLLNFQKQFFNELWWKLFVYCCTLKYIKSSASCGKPFGGNVLVQFYIVQTWLGLISHFLLPRFPFSIT